MILILSLTALLAFCSALPNGNGQGTLDTPFLDTIAAAIRKSYDNADTQNIVVVPPNCPTGQVLVNGVCRDAWRMKSNDNADTQNIVVVPPNCPTGQVLVKGVCRDAWRGNAPAKVTPIVKLECPVGYAVVGGECIDWSRNIVTVPSNCPEGQVWVNGACRDVWRAPEKVPPIVTLECPVGYSLIAGECIDWLRNVVTVPNNCPEGQQWINGACRDVWRTLDVKVEAATDPRNTVVVPDNCKPNQQWINGQCRDVWRSGSPINM